MDYGRAHHRAIHFIHRSPGTTVSNLLTILGVTKQSLNRVLRTLIDDGLVRSEKGKVDARAAPVPDAERAPSWSARCRTRSGHGCGRPIARRGRGGGGVPAGAGGDDGPGNAQRLQPPEGGRGMNADAHLLVVDDDERIRGLLQKFLIRNGFLVSVARDAAQARRLLSGP
jgi:hypothetical protein